MNFEAAYQNKNFKVGEANWAILGVFISFWRLGTFDAVSVPDRSFHERKIITNRPATMDRCDKSAIFLFNRWPNIYHRWQKVRNSYHTSISFLKNWTFSFSYRVESYVLPLTLHTSIWKKNQHRAVRCTTNNYDYRSSLTAILQNLGCRPLSQGA